MKALSVDIKGSNRNFRISILIFVLSAFTSSAYGQLTQAERFEIDITQIGGNYQVVTCEDGVLIWSKWNIRNSLDTVALKVSFLDTNLSEQWSDTFAWNRHIRLIDQKSYGSKIYILFKDYFNTGNNFELLEIDVLSGNSQLRSISNDLTFNYLDWQVTDKAVLIGGYSEFNPIVIYKNYSESLPKILPGLYGHKIEMTQINLSSDDTIEVLTAGKGKMGNRGIFINSYNQDAQLINTAKVKAPDYKHILTSGIKTPINSTSSLVAGTFSEQNTNYSQGIYITKLNHQKQQMMKFYDYTDLDSFFNYLPAGKEKRLLGRAKRKEAKNKNLKLTYNLSFERFFKYQNIFILTGSVSSTRKGNFTHAIVLAFDKDGNLLWNDRFELKETNIHWSLKKDKLNALYTIEDKIHIEIIGDDGVSGSYDSIDMDSIQLYSEDVVRSNTIGGIGKLNNNTYIISGIQSLKNKEKKGAGRNRTVFFINKLILE